MQTSVLKLVDNLDIDMHHSYMPDAAVDSDCNVVIG